MPWLVTRYEIPDLGGMPFYPSSVVASGNCVSITAFSTGLLVLDVSDPSQPRRCGYNSAVADLSSSVVTGGRLYGVSPFGGLVAFELLPFFKPSSLHGGELQLTWEGWGQARLEGTANLTASDWRNLGFPETAKSAAVPLAGPHAFFRLRQQSRTPRPPARLHGSMATGCNLPRGLLWKGGEGGPHDAGCEQATKHNNLRSKA